MQKYVNLVDLVKSFPTTYLRKSASIQPRTSLSKFGGDSIHFFIRLIFRKAYGCIHCSCEQFSVRVCACVSADIFEIAQRQRDDALCILQATQSIHARCTLPAQQANSQQTANGLCGVKDIGTNRQKLCCGVRCTACFHLHLSCCSFEKSSESTASKCRPCLPCIAR